MADPTDDFVIEHPVSIRHKVYDYLKKRFFPKPEIAGAVSNAATLYAAVPDQKSVCR